MLAGLFERKIPSNPFMMLEQEGYLMPCLSWLKMLIVEPFLN